MYIARAKDDIVDKAGAYHLGYKANDNVQILFQKFIKNKNDKLTRKIRPHNLVFSQDGYGFCLAGECYELNNLARSNIENIRWLFGGHILSPLLRGIRAVIRTIFISNAQRLSGLNIEDIHAKKYSVKHISDREASIRSDLLTTFAVV